MKRQGLFKPTLEDLIELSGIEVLHPGGFELSKRTAELAGMKNGLRVLDVSSGRGTQSVYYAKEFGAEVTGLDLSPEMITSAENRAEAEGLGGQIRFVQGDSQNLPFDNGSFDIVINECSVGIPDDSQKVLDEMVRVCREGGRIAIHETTWKAELSSAKKMEFAERYGSTPFEYGEWKGMLQKAGAKNIRSEFDRWSEPEMFWNIRQDRTVTDPRKIMTSAEKTRTLAAVVAGYGFRGLATAMKSERIYQKAVLGGKIGYCLFVADV